LSQGQLSKIETGKAALSIGALTSLCQILGRPLSYLFQKDEEIPRVLGTMTTVAGPESRGLAWFAGEVRAAPGAGCRWFRCGPPCWVPRPGSPPC